jgi:hypothetical protein
MAPITNALVADISGVAQPIRLDVPDMVLRVGR